MSRQHIDKVVDEAARWGVPVFFVDVNDLPWEFRSPADNFTACDWRRKRLYVDTTAHMAKAAISLLHELSHVIFDKNPDRVDEIASGMLAFEYHTARRLGMLRAWRLWMRPYGLTDGGSWEYASNYRRKADLKLSRAAAQKCGILRGWTPTYVSPRWE